MYNYNNNNYNDYLTGIKVLICHDFCRRCLLFTLAHDLDNAAHDHYLCHKHHVRFRDEREFSAIV